MSLKRFHAFHREANAKFMANRNPVTLELLKKLSGVIDLTAEFGSAEADVREAEREAYAVAACADANERRAPDDQEDCTDLG